jgi:cytochrome c biogenesis protein CcmG/thiol:disulfide interchange protein DsbE
MVRALTVFAALLLSAAPALAIPHAGDRAPALALTDTNGKPVTLAAYAGKPVYLNFFATWCGPCREETPTIVALSKKYAHRGLRVIGVDVGESAPKAAGFATEFKVPYTLVVDPNTTTMSSYGGGMYFPVHVFIDRHGVVKLYHPGEMNASEIEAAIASISHEGASR